MIVKLLRYLDILIGMTFPLIYKFSKKEKGSRAVKNILMIKFWGLGNLIILSSLILKVKKHYPDSRITFLTFDLNRGFLERNKAINRLIYFKFTRNLFKIAYQFIRILSSVKKDQFDLVINYETFNNTSALFCYLTGIPLRIGLNNKYESCLYTYSIGNHPFKHISDNFNDLLSGLKINSPFAYFNFEGSDAECEKIRSMLRNDKISRFICIHPGSSKNFTHKRWGEDNYSALSGRLIGAYRMPIIFTGSGAEKELVGRIIKNTPFRDMVFNWAGILNFGELIELLRSAFLFIANDSGPVHMAASLGINLAAFYGPTTPKRYGPLNLNSVVFYNNFKCSPCVGMNYTNPVCRNQIRCMGHSPDSVFAKIGGFFKDE